MPTLNPKTVNPEPRMLNTYRSSAQKGEYMRRLLIAGIVIAGLVLGACAPAITHLITMKNGDVIEATNEPVVNKATGYVEYLDKESKKVKIKEEDVSMIKQK